MKNKMANRIERCSDCRSPLQVPEETHTVRCGVCQATTKIKSSSGPDNPISYISKRAKGFVNTVSSSINKAFGSVNSYMGSDSYGHGSGYWSYSRPSRPLRPLFSSYGRKRAVLCGVSYYGKSYRLKGTVNDVKCMRYLLIERFRFPSDCILMLTAELAEDERNPLLIPTKQNMRMAMRWMVEGSNSGDSLVFHYSGHASRQQDYDMDEVDGYDEVLCPVDHETEGAIVDDEINATIVRPLPPGVKLHAIMDACHSGTLLDLPFVCRINTGGYYAWEDQRLPMSEYKGTSGGLAICISSCDDNQTSVDTNAMTGNVATGAMTYSFIQAAQQEPGLTYARLLTSMYSAVRGANTGMRLSGAFASLLNRTFFGEATSQVPQLSSSEIFDVNSTQFSL